MRILECVITLRASFIQTGKGMGIDAVSSLFIPKRLLAKEREKGEQLFKTLKECCLSSTQRAGSMSVGGTHCSKKFIEKQCF